MSGSVGLKGFQSCFYMELEKNSNLNSKTTFSSADLLSIIQLTEEFECPAKTVFANNSMIIDLRLRLRFQDKIKTVAPPLPGPRSVFSR